MIYINGHIHCHSSMRKHHTSFRRFCFLKLIVLRLWDFTACSRAAPGCARRRVALRQVNGAYSTCKAARHLNRSPNWNCDWISNASRAPVKFNVKLSVKHWVLSCVERVPGTGYNSAPGSALNIYLFFHNRLRSSELVRHLEVSAAASRRRCNRFIYYTSRSPAARTPLATLETRTRFFPWVLAMWAQCNTLNK